MKELGYILSVKNPYTSGKRTSKTVNYPNELKKKFHNLRFISANPPELLNYEGVELLLIGAETQLRPELPEESHST